MSALIRILLHQKGGIFNQSYKATKKYLKMV